MVDEKSGQPGWYSSMVNGITGVQSTMMDEESGQPGRYSSMVNSITGVQLIVMDEPPSKPQFAEITNDTIIELYGFLAYDKWE